MSMEEKEGLEGFLGKKIEIQTPVYIYAGKVIAVSKSCIKLEKGGIVFETGDFKSNKYKDFQVKGTLYIPTQAILCFMETDKF